MDGRQRVGWNLRRVRTRASITQEMLAYDAGVDRSTVSGIENASFNPTVDLLEKLAKTLDIDIAEFFVATDGKEPPKPLSAGRKATGRGSG